MILKGGPLDGMKIADKGVIVNYFSWREFRDDGTEMLLEYDGDGFFVREVPA